MLSLSQEHPSRAVRRPPRSLKQEYHEFLLQRIEEYKNALSREELLEIGDEAVRELEANAEGQYLLTEVLLLEHVDRIIARRLRLPSFPRWREKHRALRTAQREPTHWGVESDGPLVSCAVTEQLAGRFQALMITFGSWFPDVSPSVVVIDPGALAPTRGRHRNALLTDLQTRTRPGGLHIILPSPTAAQVIPLGPEALQAQYGGWEITRRRRAKAGAGFTATKPERHVDTAARVSD